ncbi:hypothetical protein J3F84DRAFT_377976 [Trichoderma pleuroticola]
MYMMGFLKYLSTLFISSISIAHHLLLPVLGHDSFTVVVSVKQTDRIHVINLALFRLNLSSLSYACVQWLQLRAPLLMNVNGKGQITNRFLSLVFFLVPKKQNRP